MTPSRRSGRTQAANARKPTTRSGTMTQRHSTLPSSPTRTDKIVEEEEEEEEEEDTEEEDDEEESSDSASVTRCLCGEQHNMGLMVQCDKCEVWQHCECVGLTERDLPDLYYCDHCQPNNHVLYKTNGRVKRVYNPNGCEKTEDNQSNNGTPEKQVDEPDLRATKRRKREMNGTRKTTSNNNNKPISSRRQPTTSTPMATRTQKNGLEKHEEETADNDMHDQNNSHPASPDQKIDEQFQQQSPSPQLSSSQQQVVTPRRIRRKSGDDNNQGSSPLSEEPLPSPPVSRGRKQAKSGGRRNIHQHGSPQRQTNGRHKESPRATTPLVSSDDASGNNHHSNGNSASNGNAAAATPTPQLYWDEEGLPSRESSPPAKVKYPNPKMSIADMNKRAKQIMDYVNKMHVDLSKKRPEPHHPPQPEQQQQHQSKPNPENVKRQRTRSDSTSSSSSSLSSASTLPLLEDDEHHPNNQHYQQQKYSPLGSMASPTTPIPVVALQQPETTLDMVDRITRDLIQFQRKFGGSFVASSNAMVSSPRAKKFCRH